MRTRRSAARPAVLAGRAEHPVKLATSSPRPRCAETRRRTFAMPPPAMRPMGRIHLWARLRLRPHRGESVRALRRQLARGIVHAALARPAHRRRLVPLRCDQTRSVGDAQQPRPDGDGGPFGHGGASDSRIARRAHHEVRRDLPRRSTSAKSLRPQRAPSLRHPLRSAMQRDAAIPPISANIKRELQHVLK